MGAAPGGASAKLAHPQRLLTRRQSLLPQTHRANKNPDFSHHWLHAEKRQWSSVAAFEASNGFVVRKASQGRAQSCGRAVKFWRQRHPPRPSIPSSAGAQAHSLWATANTWVGEATTSHDVQGQRAGRHIGTLETDPGKTPP